MFANRFAGRKPNYASTPRHDRRLIDKEQPCRKYQGGLDLTGQMSLRRLTLLNPAYFVSYILADVDHLGLIGVLC